MIKRMTSEIRKGHSISQKTKDKISKTLSGRKLSSMHSANIRKAQTGIKRSQLTRDKLSGPKSSSHKENLSKSLIGKSKSKSHRENMMKPKSEDHVNKIKEFSQNRAWISKDGITKRIYKDDLALFLSEGWLPGRKR